MILNEVLVSIDMTGERVAVRGRADWTFYRHMPVYLRGGVPLGRLEEVGHAVDYLAIQQGHRLVQDWYVPLAAVETVDASGIRLLVDIADMRERGWNVPSPEFLRQQGATPGYEYTSAIDILSFNPSTTTEK